MEIQKQEEKEEGGASLPPYVQMYEISGHDAITAHSFRRYQKDKEASRGTIENLIKNSASSYRKKIDDAPDEEKAGLIRAGFANGNQEIQSVCAWKIASAPENKKASLIRDALFIPIPDIQKKGAEMIEYLASEEEKMPLREQIASLVTNLLKSDDSELQVHSVSMISYAPDKMRSSLIRSCLLSDNADVLKESARAIRYVSPEERASIVKIGLRSKNPEAQREFARAIGRVSDGEQGPLRAKVALLIEEGFAGGSAKQKKTYADMIEYAPDDKQKPLREKAALLVKQGFAHNNEEEKEDCAWMIRHAPDAKISPLIQAGMNTGNANAGRISARMIEYAPKNERSALIRKGFESGISEIQTECVAMIRCAPAQEQASLIDAGLRTGNAAIQKRCAALILDISKEEAIPIQEKIAEIIEEGFANGRAEDMEEYALMIRYADKDKKAFLIRLGLSVADEKTRRRCLSMIPQVSENDKKELLKTAKEKLGDALVEPPLYAGGAISGETFSRKKFEKTGFETTLIGGELKGKTILRQMTPEQFTVWQELYENHDLWKKAGFDYVPIEPIQSFKVNKNGMLDVASGALDLSFESWRNLSGDFSEELDKDRKALLKVLIDNAFMHGHQHGNNFCLRFWRDENGHVDFAKKPRLYLIDFDQAESFQE